jgi:RNA polymerase sigma-70 factor (ECF subfamily)
LRRIGNLLQKLCQNPNQGGKRACDAKGLQAVVWCEKNTVFIAAMRLSNRRALDVCVTFVSDFTNYPTKARAVKAFTPTTQDLVKIVKPLPANQEQFAHAGAVRLLARATETYGLEATTLTPRLAATLEKYLWRDTPEASSGEIEGFLEGLRADDLCLVVACERGDDKAWADLVSRYGPTVRSAARTAAGNEDAAEDLAQSIWAELHGLRVRADGLPAGKLGYYSGRGSLGGWLRAVVGQLAVDQHRKTARYVQAEEDTELDRLANDAEAARENHYMADGAANPEDELLHSRTAHDVEQSLAQAIRELGPEDRLLVKLYYFDNLRLREVGTMLGFHEATASRRLARLQTDLRHRVEKLLQQTHGWTKTETARSLTEAAAHINANLEAMLLGERPSHGP